MSIGKDVLDGLAASISQEELESLVTAFYGKCYKVQYCGDPDSETKKELEERCRHYADYMREIYRGEVKKCGKCGAAYNRVIRKDGEVVYKRACGCEGRAKAEEYTLDNFLDGAFDAEYTVNGNGAYNGVRFYLDTGGPTIYADTNTKFVEGRWGGGSVSVPLDYDVSDAVEDVGEQWYERVACR